MSNFDAAVAAAIDASRPRISGPSVNIHVVRAPKVQRPDYERMRVQIEGRPDESAKDVEQNS